MQLTDRQERARLLLRDFAPRLYRYALVRLGQADLAEDAVSETICRLIELGPDLAGDERHVHGWSVRCMVNVCREFERKPRPMGHSEPADATFSARVPSTFDADETAVLVGAMSRLPARQREAVTLRILMEHSVAETAEAMECATGTVKALTHQGLAALDTMLTSSTIKIGLAS